MPATWLYNFTPQMLAPLGYAAWGVLLAGLVLWLFGVAIARIAVAAFLGTLVSGLAVLLATHFQISVTPATAGIVGFVTGAVAGALGFRVLQGFTLALVLGVTVAGLYYHWHAHTPPAPNITQLPIDSLKISTDNFPETPLSTHEKPHFDLSKLLEFCKTRLFALSLQDQQRMGLAAAGAAIAALLLAFGFPKMTTATISALVGSLFILTAANLFMLTNQVTSPRGTLPAWWPTSLAAWGILLALLACVGIAIQYRFFIRRSDKPQMKTA
jgi:hypothetical protein